MANYQGNPQGGVALPGREPREAAASFLRVLENSGGGGGNGMGLGAFLNGGQPVALPVANDPVMTALASAGGTDPIASLMGILGSGGASGTVNPMSALMAAASGGGGAENASTASDPQMQLEDAVVNALSNPDFARQLVRSDPSVLQKVVKLLSSSAWLGG